MAVKLAVTKIALTTDFFLHFYAGHKFLAIQSTWVLNHAFVLFTSAQEQENWLLAGWERSKYDDEPGASLGVIVNIDRVVVVTGVSSGIGYAIAKSLVEHQCHVFGRCALYPKLVPVPKRRSLCIVCEMGVSPFLTVELPPQREEGGRCKAAARGVWGLFHAAAL